MENDNAGQQHINLFPEAPSEERARLDAILRDAGPLRKIWFSRHQGCTDESARNSDIGLRDGEPVRDNR
jgi:hypothetical protein